MKRIAINGFGRIGRASLKVIMDTPDLEIVAVNDLMTLENAAYLLTYDSIYGKYNGSVIMEDNHLVINDKKVLFFYEKDPAKLPWKNLDIDIVIECTGLFTKREDAEKHILAGAHTVIISGPTKSKDTPTVVHGVNTADGKTNIFSCGSCTTNNIGPLIEILGRRLGIKKAILNSLPFYETRSYKKRGKTMLATLPIYTKQRRLFLLFKYIKTYLKPLTSKYPKKCATLFVQLSKNQGMFFQTLQKTYNTTLKQYPQLHFRWN